MTDNEFDDSIQKRFSDHEAPVPPGMWERINADKKKRRIGFWWLKYSIPLLIVLSLSALYTAKIIGKQSNGHTAVALRNQKDSVHTTNRNHAPGIALIQDTTALVQQNNSGTAAKTMRGLSYRKNITGNALHKNRAAQLLPGGQDSAERRNDQYTGNSLFNKTEQDSAMPMVKKITNNQNIPDSSTHEAVEAEMDNKDRFSLFFAVSPDIPFSSIQSSNSDYAEILRQDSRMQLSRTVEAGISLRVSKKFSLVTGVQYSHVNEKVSFYDSVLNAGSSSLDHYTFINIPLMVMYKTSWTTSVQTSVRAGIMVNLSSTYKGTIPDMFCTASDISHNTYLRNTGITLYTGINFSKKLTDKIDVFAGPFLRYQVKDITSNLQPFNRRLAAAGVGIGISYRLFRTEE